MESFAYLGPYRVEAKIGWGGMGAVYRAEHAKTGEKVAVKVIASAVADQPRFQRRFHAEVETLKKLRHPNIVRLIGYGEEAGHLFYSMELVEGPSLEEHLRRVRKMPWPDVLAVAIDIASALKHAHDFGVIHRDLKPANLLLSPEGPLKLTDFGIAKLFGGIEMTVAGSVLGTADYMAPEQAGDGPITPRTDLYALGSVMYACLIGRPPFSGHGLTKVLESLRHEPPARLDLIDPELPADVVEIVHDLLAKDPADRPPTALVVGKRLRAMRQGLLKAREEMRSGSAGAGEPPPAAGNVREADQPPPDSLPTTDRATIDATGASASEKPSSHSETALSIGGTTGDVADRETPNPPQTRFTAVEDEPAGAEVSPTAPAKTHDLWGWLSVAGLAAALVGLVAVGIWLARAPSADVLLGEIEQAERRGNLSEAGPQVEQFLARFPEHPQADEVQRIQDLLELERTIRRLESRAARSGGTDQLPPASQAFLEAMQMRDTQPAEAHDRLQNWLAVYGSDAVRDPELRRLASLARTARERIASTDSGRPDERSAELAAWMQWAETHLPPDRLPPFYEGIIRLYEDKPWAEEQVETARARLAN